jgi:PHP family Zn ribbon phosphoesterase
MATKVKSYNAYRINVNGDKVEFRDQKLANKYISEYWYEHEEMLNVECVRYVLDCGPDREYTTLTYNLYEPNAGKYQLYACARCCFHNEVTDWGRYVTKDESILGGILCVDCTNILEEE